MDLKEEQLIGGDPKSHWYYIAKGQAIMSLLGESPAGSILDVGAGSGVFSKMLVEEGRACRALCVDPGYDESARAKSDGRVDFACAAAPDEISRVDTVLMIDVIEHVPDDVGLIRQYADHARDGARFLIAAPAFQFLWSSHDEFLDHYRRYTLGGLEKAVGAAGLRPITSRYFFGAIFPAVAALRLAEKVLPPAEAKSQMRAAQAWLNKTMVALHALERLALMPVNRLAGLTAFCLAEKPAVAQSAKAA